MKWLLPFYFTLLAFSFTTGLFYGFVSSVKVKEYRKIYIPSCRYYYSAREQWGPGDYYNYKGQSCVEVIAKALNKKHRR